MTVFKGVKVLELASVLAGPSVGQFFAELGAEVIKIENPKADGDVTRSWKSAGETTDDVSAYFSCVNWGKMSVSLDISQSEGLQLLYDLVKRCEIIISSYKPGDDEKLKVDYKSLKQLNPAIIYGQITGYGSDKDLVGYDAIIQAEAGFMAINGEPNSSPLKMPVALMDILAGHQLKEALLLAYIEKLKTGTGSFVEVSLIDAGLSSLANQATNFLVAGIEPKQQGSAHPNIAPYGEVYKTKDNKSLILAVGSEKQFNALREVLGMAADDQFNGNANRVKHRKELNEKLASQIINWKAVDLMPLLNKNKIPAGLVNTVSEAINTHAHALKLQSETISGLRNFVAKGLFSQNSSHLLPPPHFGEHTRYVLKEIIGIAESEIAELKKLRII